MASTGPTSPFDNRKVELVASPVRIQPANEAAQHVLDALSDGGTAHAAAMATICRDRAAELAAMPLFLATALITNGIVAATCAFAAGDPLAPDDVLATLRHLLAVPSLRVVAIKASRFKSLASVAIQTASQLECCDNPRADGAATAVLRLLWDVGVDIASAGTLDEDGPPLHIAVAYSLLNSAQVLVDAGTDVNGLSRDGTLWPLCAAAWPRCDAGMAWLLERGASLTMTNTHGRTIAHALAVYEDTGLDSSTAASEGFCCRWLRRVVAAEPSLLEARDDEGETPLLSAAGAGSTASVAALLELGADVGAHRADAHTALSLACHAVCLPVVRQLIAAGAASAAALPPGSLQARTAGASAAFAALEAEWGCGTCVACCGGDNSGDCADGLDILRAVLAAGGRELKVVDGRSGAVAIVEFTHHSYSARSTSEGHALTILQVLHAAGVDVLARGPADPHPVLHVAAAVNAPAVVRWLVAEAGAPLEERDSDGHTPLLRACRSKAWAAAHALLDCGARVDVQSTDEEGWWPVVHAAATGDPGCALLRRILAADCDSLLRCGAGGESALQIAAFHNSDALQLLLGSGLPHLSEAINATADWQLKDRPEAVRVTPLHLACQFPRWDAALALLAAGARVDIAGEINCRLQTMAEWARSSPACKHRGVKLAIAARAREHASETGKAASGGAGSATISMGSGPDDPSAEPPTSSAAGVASVAPGSGKGAVSGADVASAGAGVTATAVAAPAAARGAGKKQAQAGKGKGRQGAASNRAEVPSDDAVGDRPGPQFAAAVATAAAAAASSVCDKPGSAVSPAIACNAGAPTLIPSAANWAEETSATLALTSTAAPVAVEASSPRAAAHATAPAGAVAPADCAFGMAASANSANVCEPQPDLACTISSSTCEPGAVEVAAIAAALTAPSQSACGEASAAGSTVSPGATLLAALRDEAASVAAVRGHLTALSELARDPSAAAALLRQGVLAAVAAALSRHGVAILRAVTALVILLDSVSPPE